MGRGARTVPAALQQMVWARSLGAALRPVAEIVTDRTVRRLVDVTGARRGGGGRRPGHGPPAAAHRTAWGTRRRPRPRGGRSRSSSATATATSCRRSTPASGSGACSEAPSASKLAQVLDVQPGDPDRSAKGRKLTVDVGGGRRPARPPPRAGAAGPGAGPAGAPGRSRRRAQDAGGHPPAAQRADDVQAALRRRGGPPAAATSSSGWPASWARRATRRSCATGCARPSRRREQAVDGRIRRPRSPTPSSARPTARRTTGCWPSWTASGTTRS